MHIGVAVYLPKAFEAVYNYTQYKHTHTYICIRVYMLVTCPNLILKLSHGELTLQNLEYSSFFVWFSDPQSRSRLSADPVVVARRRLELGQGCHDSKEPTVDTRKLEYGFRMSFGGAPSFVCFGIRGWS